jgi:3-oxoadipate enol-lactonase
MVGDHDLPYMIESADLLVRRIAGAARATVAGAGHLVNLEQPAAFNDAVLTFLEKGERG